MSELPKRDAKALIESLRIRALALTGEAWERTATRDMMKEAAQMLEDLTSSAALHGSEAGPQEVESKRDLGDILAGFVPSLEWKRKSYVGAETREEGAEMMPVIDGLRRRMRATLDYDEASEPALFDIGVMAMTAQSDPHASAEVYRKALIDICNFALAAQDKLQEGAKAGPQEAREQPDNADLAANLRYARGLLRRAASSGASFVDINADVLRYLVENRRTLNDRLRWAEQRAAGSEAGVSARVLELEARNQQLESAIRWALGDEGDFGAEPPPINGRWLRAFWWRGELRSRAALGVSPAAPEKELK